MPLRTTLAPVGKVPDPQLGPAGGRLRGRWVTDRGDRAAIWPNVTRPTGKTSVGGFNASQTVEPARQPEPTVGAIGS